MRAVNRIVSQEGFNDSELETLVSYNYLQSMFHGI